MNGNVMYFLNGSGTDSETWATQNGQSWALTLDMNNNNAAFGGNVSANYYSGNGGGLTNISSSSHNHDSSYASASHTHSGYASSTHDHSYNSLTTIPTMYVGNKTASGPSATDDIDVITSSTYNRYVEISINNEVISYSIIWKNNSPALTNYYTYSDGYYYSLVQNLAPYGSPTYNRYTFWRRTGTFVWRVIEFL